MAPRRPQRPARHERRAHRPPGEAALGRESGPFDNVSRQQVSAAVGVLLDELGTPRDREILTRVYLRDEDKDDVCFSPCGDLFFGASRITI